MRFKRVESFVLNVNFKNKFIKQFWFKIYTFLLWNSLSIFWLYYFLKSTFSLLKFILNFLFHYFSKSYIYFYKIHFLFQSPLRFFAATSNLIPHSIIAFYWTQRNVSTNISKQLYQKSATNLKQLFCVRRTWLGSSLISSNFNCFSLNFLKLKMRKFFLVVILERL